MSRDTTHFRTEEEDEAGRFSCLPIETDSNVVNVAAGEDFFMFINENKVFVGKISCCKSQNNFVLFIHHCLCRAAHRIFLRIKRICASKEFAHQCNGYHSRLPRCRPGRAGVRFPAVAGRPVQLRLEMHTP